MLNCFDATGSISLPPPKITSIEPSRFSQLFHQCGFNIIPLPSSRGPCIKTAKEGSPITGVSLLYR